MPNLNEPTPWDFHTEGPSLTEQEHKDSCDINKMLGKLAQGQQVRGGPSPQYGEDDTTMSAADFHILKHKTLTTLQEIAELQEFSEDEIKIIPKEVAAKFNFKVKKAQNNELNDEKGSLPPQTPPLTKPS